MLRTFKSCWTIFAFSGLSFLIVAGCQDYIQKSNDYLDRPASTQPGSPTHKEVIESVTTAATTVVPQPYGGLISGVVTIGLLVLHNLDSRKRTNTNDKKTDQVSDQLTDLNNNLLYLSSRVNELHQDKKGNTGG